MNVRRALPAIVVSFSCAAAACVSLSRDYPDRHFYVLEVERGDVPPRGRHDAVLRVRPVRSAAPWGGIEFLYRKGDVSVESDYYNAFLVPPQRLITLSVERWLRASEMFAGVLGSGQRARADYVLEGEIDELCGDETDPDEPKASLSSYFYLTSARSGPDALVFVKGYRRSVSVADSTPEALVEGWQRALSEILTELESDLEEAVRDAESGS